MSESFGKIPKGARLNCYCSAGYSVDGPAVMWVRNEMETHTHTVSYYLSLRDNSFLTLNFSKILIMLPSRLL